jgi:N-acetylglucosamine transport system substrate-binding protein
VSTRRTLLTGASALALTACATNAGKSGDDSAKGTASNENPLGVASDAPLEVVIFKGGYGDQYAQQARDAYRQRHAKSSIDYKAIQRVGEVLQPRFISDSPPDVVDNTGAGRLDLATLVLPGVVDEGIFDGKPLVLNYASVLWGIWYSKSLFAQRGWAYPKAGVAPWT